MEDLLNAKQKILKQVMDKATNSLKLYKIRVSFVS